MSGHMLDFFKRFGLRAAAANPISPQLWQQAAARIPFVELLHPDEWQRLHAMVPAFLADKEFHGANGLVVDDTMMVVIAMQACLPVLNLGLDAYRGWVGIIVYPGEIVIPRHQAGDDGVVHEFDDTVLGEAWANGPVLLAWHDDVDAQAGVNVVIHEFAHKLDMANGDADGFPALRADMSRADWSRAFSAAYAHFCAEVDAVEATGRPPEALALDPYAAESPAEFFAVASEAFFEVPDLLQDAYPEVYAQLSHYYGFDLAPRARTLFGEPPAPADV